MFPGAPGLPASGPAGVLTARSPLGCLVRGGPGDIDDREKRRPQRPWGHPGEGQELSMEVGLVQSRLISQASDLWRVRGRGDDPDPDLAR